MTPIKPPTKTLAFAVALTFAAATGAFAQASNSQPSSGSTMMKQAPKSDTTKMKSDAADMSAKSDQSASADTSAKPKMHRKMARNEAQLNEQEAETTKQLNEQQSQYAK